MSRKAFIAGSGETVKDAAADAVRKHYEDQMSLSEIENIVVEENGKRRVITDRDEIRAFLDQHNR